MVCCGCAGSWLTGCGLRRGLRRRGTAGVIVTVQMVDVKNQHNRDDKNHNCSAGDGVNHQARRDIFYFLDRFFGDFPRLNLRLLFFTARSEIRRGRRRRLKCRRGRRWSDIDFLQRRQFGHLRKADSAAATRWGTFRHHRVNGNSGRLCTGRFYFWLIENGGRHGSGWRRGIAGRLNLGSSVRIGSFQVRCRGCRSASS